MGGRTLSVPFDMATKSIRECDRSPLRSHRADVLPGDRARCPPGGHRALPDLEPRALGDPAAAAGLDRRRRGAVGARSPTSSRSWSASTWRPHWPCWSSTARPGRGSSAASSPPSGLAGSRRPTSASAGCSSSPRSRPGVGACSSSTAARWSSPSRSPRPRFLVLNGLILLFGEWVRRRAEVRRVVAAHATNAAGDRRLDTLEFREAGAIGVAQVFALLPGISRSGITMVAGLARGLDHEDAARFSFLLATPIILAAGVYKLPDLLGPNGDGVRRPDPRREHRRRPSPRTCRSAS